MSIQWNKKWMDRKIEEELEKYEKEKKKKKMALNRIQGTRGRVK